MRLNILAPDNTNDIYLQNTNKHNSSASDKATNILTCNLDPLRGVVLVRARNGYRPRQVSASVFALLSNNSIYTQVITESM